MFRLLCAASCLVMFAGCTQHPTAQEAFNQAAYAENRASSAINRAELLEAKVSDLEDRIDALEAQLEE